MTLALAAALVGFLAPDARAATAAATNGQLFYESAAGESNDVAVTLAYRSATHDYAVTVADTGASITPGGACSAVTPNEVICEPVMRLELTLGSGADSLTVLGAGRNTAGECLLTAHGGRGNDLLSGSSHADCLFGGRGDDRLEGHAGERLYSFEPTEQLEGGQATTCCSAVSDRTSWSAAMARTSSAAGRAPPTSSRTSCATEASGSISTAPETTELRASATSWVETSRTSWAARDATCSSATPVRTRSPGHRAAT